MFKYKEKSLSVHFVPNECILEHTSIFFFKILYRKLFCLLMSVTIFLLFDYMMISCYLVEERFEAERWNSGWENNFGWSAGIAYYAECNCPWCVILHEPNLLSRHNWLGMLCVCTAFTVFLNRPLIFLSDIVISIFPSMILTSLVLIKNIKKWNKNTIIGSSLILQ